MLNFSSKKSGQVCLYKKHGTHFLILANVNLNSKEKFFLGLEKNIM